MVTLCWAKYFAATFGHYINFYQSLTLEEVAGLKRMLYIQDLKIHHKSPWQLRQNFCAYVYVCG